MSTLPKVSDFGGVRFAHKHVVSFDVAMYDGAPKVPVEVFEASDRAVRKVKVLLFPRRLLGRVTEDGLDRAAFRELKDNAEFLGPLVEAGPDEADEVTVVQRRHEDNLVLELLDDGRCATKVRGTCVREEESCWACWRHAHL